MHRNHHLLRVLVRILSTGHSEQGKLYDAFIPIEPPQHFSSSPRFQDFRRSFTRSQPVCPWSEGPICKLVLNSLWKSRAPVDSSGSELIRPHHISLNFL